MRVHNYLALPWKKGRRRHFDLLSPLNSKTASKFDGLLNSTSTTVETVSDHSVNCPPCPRSKAQIRSRNQSTLRTRAADKAIKRLLTE